MYNVATLGWKLFVDFRFFSGFLYTLLSVLFPPNSSRERIILSFRPAGILDAFSSVFTFRYSFFVASLFSRYFFLLHFLFLSTYSLLDTFFSTLSSRHSSRHFLLDTLLNTLLNTLFSKLNGSSRPESLEELFLNDEPLTAEPSSRKPQIHNLNYRRPDGQSGVDPSLETIKAEQNSATIFSVAIFIKINTGKGLELVFGRRLPIGC